MGVLIVSFAMIAVRAIGTRAHVTCDALDGLLVLVVCRSIDNWIFFFFAGNLWYTQPIDRFVWLRRRGTICRGLMA